MKNRIIGFGFEIAKKTKFRNRFHPYLEASLHITNLSVLAGIVSIRVDVKRLFHSWKLFSDLVDQQNLILFLVNCFKGVAIIRENPSAKRR